MSTTPITTQQLIDAATDSETLASVTNGPASGAGATVTSRLGATMPTLSAAVSAAATAIQPKGTYNPATTYGVGAVVSFGSPVSTYVSLVASNVGHTPDTSPTFWQLFAQAGTPGPTTTAQLKAAASVPVAYATAKTANVTSQGVVAPGSLLNATANVTCVLPNPFIVDGYISQISLYISSAIGTTVDFIILSAAGTTFTVVNRITLTSTSVGMNTFVSGYDFAPISVSAGQFAGFITSGTAQVVLNHTSGSGTNAGFWYSGTDIGATPTVLTAQGNQLLFAVQLTSFQDSLLAYTKANLNIPPVTMGVMASGGLNFSAFQLAAVTDRQRCPSDGYLTQLQIDIHTAGSIDVVVLTSAGGSTFTVDKRFTIVAAATGNQTFNAGIDYPLISIKKNQYIGVFTSGTGVPTATTGFAAQIYSFSGTAFTDAQVGSTVTCTLGNIRLNLTYTIVPTVSPIPLDIKTRNEHGNRVPLLDTTFPGTLLPRGVTISAGSGWTVNNGLISPTTGQGYGTTLSFPNDFALNKRTIRVQFQITAANATIGVGSIANASNYDNIQMSLIWVDAAAATLNMGNAYNGTAAPTVNTSAPLGFTMSIGKTYTLIITIDSRVLTASITDAVTGIMATVTQGNNATDNGTYPTYGLLQDKLSLVAISGTYTVSRLTVLANIRQPHVAILGDSITYGLYNTIAQTWAGQIAAAVGSATISGRPGGASAGMLTRFISEVIPMMPDTVIFMMGTNDVNHGITSTVYQDNILQCITMAKAIGAKVCVALLTTLVAGSGSTTAQAFNTWLLTLPVDGWLRFDLATSTGNDGVTQNTALFESDHLHPNPAGHAAMYARVLVDAPWLLD